MYEEKQIIIACDDSGNLGGYIPKEVGHIGDGQRHLAIAVLLINQNGEVLLQKRKHRVFDDIWDVTGATHPLHRPDGTDETLEEATLRCVKREFGIEPKEVRNLKSYGAFNYFAKDGNHCENEYCAMMVGEYDGEVSLNPQEGYGYKWISKEEFIKDIERSPGKYTPWAREGVKLYTS